MSLNPDYNARHAVPPPEQLKLKDAERTVLFNACMILRRHRHMELCSFIEQLLYQAQQASER